MVILTIDTRLLLFTHHKCISFIAITFFTCIILCRTFSTSTGDLSRSICTTSLSKPNDPQKHTIVEKTAASISTIVSSGLICSNTPLTIRPIHWVRSLSACMYIDVMLKSALELLFILTDTKKFITLIINDRIPVIRTTSSLIF
ncbi:hypothetical protein NEIRO03_2123 [Nematocida sp. AWRm78]|nr:hypothetical protein NEIRO03_2123 [Nematocida sp. AWRm78]